MFELN